MKHFKNILTDLKKQIPLMLMSTLFSLIVVGGTLYVPILIGKAIDCIVYGDVQFSAIAEYLIQILFVVAVVAVFQWFMNLIHTRVTYHTVRDLRDRAFAKIQKLPLSYLDSHSPGDIVSRMIVDVDTVADGLLMGLTQLFSGVMTIAGTLVFMFCIAPGMAAVVVCVTPLSLLVARFISKHTFSMFVEQSKIRGEQTSYIDEMLTNIKLVEAYEHEDRAEEKFDEINGRLLKCSRKAVFYSSLTNPCTRFVNSVVYALVAMTGAFFCISGALSVGALTTFLSYANQYTKPFNEISGVITELQNAFASMERIYRFLEEEEEQEEKGKQREINTATGTVCCNHVSFSYQPEKKLIEDFSLTVKPGQKVAIVGPTGCGKTTLINLFMRFYDVNDGEILLDGVNLKYMSRHSLRKNYGMVLQETWLKSGTIRENICFGKEDATMEEVIEAAKASHAHSFIKRLPDGYDTVIGENDSLLSAGQKQLLCITRVMLNLPPMLILDEATSSIDTRTERKIQNAFEKMMEGRTSLIVAHRLSTIQNADIILVMKDGKVIEQGSHEELLAQKGFYAKLFYSQFAESALNTDKYLENTV